MSKKEKEISEDDLDDLIDIALDKQDQILNKCQMRYDPDKKKAEWEERFGK